ncbi:MAG: tryptophan synthase subunit beta [Deltaproteobacteria bacterium]|nr:tryptophan synthase subunit beta [Deltaproteobacteria bacterium]
MTNFANSSGAPKPWTEGPGPAGRYGPWGGRYVPETLMPALFQLEEEFRAAWADPAFQAELAQLSRDYIGRATPLYEAKRLTAELGGPRIFLKREDLAHTGSHKLNNALGQALLAKRMGKTRLIAETGAGQHGVASATAAALMGLECVVFMGEVDMARQAHNVERMRLLGTTVEPVLNGARTLKDATSQAIREWVGRLADTHYIIGSVVGPHPYPFLVRELQSVIGRETRGQILAQAGRLPRAMVACVGGGSNSMGMFHPFLADEGVELIGVEAAGHGIETGQHAASLSAGSAGVLHGAMIYMLQDVWGQVLEAHSIAAGLDYPGVGPEHCLLKDCGRVGYAAVTDQEALAAFRQLCRLEGIIPALESSHALAYLPKLVQNLKQDDLVVVCLSGRGDKDMSPVQGTV